VDATGQELRPLLEEHARAAAGRIDPRAGVMVQAVWFDRGPAQPGRLLVVIAHLVVDTVSLRILLPDLAEAYTTLAAGREVTLPPVPTSFRHWARSLAAQQRRDELPAWIGILHGPDQLLTAEPVDPDRDLGATMREMSVHVPTELTTALLTTVPAAFHAGVDDVLLTGLAAAIAERHPGGVLIDVESHGRSGSDGVDLSRTVGWFTGTHPVRLDPGVTNFAEARRGGPAAGRAVKRVKEQLRAVPGDGLGYGILRYLDTDSAAALADLPKARIGFNYLGRLGAQTQDRDWSPAAAGGPVGGAGDALPVAHALEAMGAVHDRPAGPELTLTLAGPARLLTEPVARALLDGWVAMLTGLAGHAARPDSGGHTPSDFALIAIDQVQIDDLETELADEWSAR
jgi:non-ribosomal peptide synthase protein (TIGR01720 family)